MDFRENFGKPAAIIAIAAVIAFAFLLYMWWSHKWDQPAAEDRIYSSTMHYQGDELQVSVRCVDCPRELAVSRPRTLHFEITLKDYPWALKEKKIGLWYDAGGQATLDPIAAYWLAKDNRSGEAKAEFTLKITPQDTDFAAIAFHLTAWDVAADGKETGTSAPIGTLYAGLPAHPLARQVIAPYAYAFVIFVVFASAFYYVQRRLTKLREKADSKIADLQLQAKQNPEKAKFAWDLARVKLEEYFDRNLIQVNLVFWVAVFVMIVGFTFVLAGVVLSYSQPKMWTTSMVAAVSGIITQFLGATFMVIYRSTMAQANEYMSILERINSVGMAVQVVDSLPDGTDLKNEARASVAKLLLSVGSVPARKRPQLSKD